MLRINLTFARSSLCLVRFSSDGQDGPARAVDEEADNPLVHDACTLVDNPLSDMTLSVIRSSSTSVTDFLTALSSSDIRARD
jgi:hypothetical protein